MASERDDAAAISAIPASVESLRRTFKTGRTRDVDWRRSQLRGLKRLIAEQQEEIVKALKADLNKPRGECILAEVALVSSEIDHALSNLSSWSKPASASTPMAFLPGSSRVEFEPKGVILNISPWNYPIQLALAPLVGILAAGNCCLLKPSELSSASAAFLSRFLPQYLDPEAVAVVEGGPPVATALLAHPWDHIIYTGNGTIAKVILHAAAEHLTPVTLELGGKSPCIVDKDANLAVAARRIAFGKWMNAGQTCIAPDYLLVHKDVKTQFLQLLKESAKQFYGENDKTADYARIISRRHFDRVRGLLSGGEVVFGGDCEETDNFIAPTILDNVDLSSRLMSEEIFGPLLPVIEISCLDAAIKFVTDRPKPLALYLFSGSSASQKLVCQETSSGGVCFNDCLVQVANPSVPFGGVGPSGMGRYHGSDGFAEFSHKKTVVNRFCILDPAFKYPPFSDKRVSMLRKLL